MAELGNVLTLPDIHKRLDPNRKLAQIVEMLANASSMAEDIPWKEGNLDTGEQFTVRTSLPSVYWRKANEGTPVSKSTTSQATQKCAQLEAWSEVDKRNADIGGRAKDVRRSESSAFMEAMTQELETKIIYGDEDLAPEEMSGLAKIYNADASGTTAENVIDGGGSGADNSSIYFLGWGPNTIYGFYPKGTPIGLYHKD